VQTDTIDTKELRNFGLLMGTMLAMVFGLLIPWIWNNALPLWPWIVAGVFWVWALLLPRSLGPVFRIWMKLAWVLGWINTRIILSIVFYLVVFPMGILLRLFGKDPMARHLDANAQTYRVKSTPSSPKDMERPF